MKNYSIKVDNIWCATVSLPETPVIGAMIRNTMCFHYDVLSIEYKADDPRITLHCRVVYD